jgi:hypothetical protein
MTSRFLNPTLDLVVPGPAADRGPGDDGLPEDGLLND